jgi:hypothetical protein
LARGGFGVEPLHENAQQPLTAAELDDARLRELYAFWQKLGGDAGVPRSAVDPVDIPRSLLPHLLLTEVVEDPARGRRYRYRLVGSAIVERAGSDPTWAYLDSILPTDHGYRDYILGLYDRVVDGSGPLYSHDVYVTVERAAQPELGTRRLMLPLRDGGRVDHVLSVQTFEVIQGVQPKPFLAVDGFRRGTVRRVVPGS